MDEYVRGMLLCAIGIVMCIFAGLWLLDSYVDYNNGLIEKENAYWLNETNEIETVNVVVCDVKINRGVGESKYVERLNRLYNLNVIYNVITIDGKRYGTDIYPLYVGDIYNCTVISFKSDELFDGYIVALDLCDFVDE